MIYRKLEEERDFANSVVERVNTWESEGYRTANKLAPGDFTITVKRELDEYSGRILYFGKHRGEVVWVANSRDGLKAKVGVEASCPVVDFRYRDTSFYEDHRAFARECLRRVCSNEKSLYLWMHKLEPDDLTIDVLDGVRSSRYIVKHCDVQFKHISNKTDLLAHLKLAPE